MIRYLWPLFLYASPSITFCEEQVRRFEKLEKYIYNRSTCFEPTLVRSGENERLELAYTSVLAVEEKLHFLYFLSQTGRYVFHGSNDCDIKQFEPRQQTLYYGELTKAVFASSDPMWSIFYAVLNRSRLIGSFRNGCLMGRNTTFHFYSLTKPTMNNQPWTDGMIYVLPKGRFRQSGRGRIRFDEWICEEPVAPLANFKVHQDDFYFKHKVSTHEEGESIANTWLLYKVRTSKRGPWI